MDVSALLESIPKHLLVSGPLITLLFAILIHTILTIASHKVALNPVEFQPFRLSKKEQISRDTIRLTFALQTPETKLGLPVGCHICFRYKDSDGRPVQRSYTPTSGDELLGSVVFVIKVYKANEHPKFPDGGKMSQHVDKLKVGDTLDMKGPTGHLHYLGKGKFTVKKMRKPAEERQASKFGLIAGGTGITPMYQLITNVLSDVNDTTTTMSLLFANQTEEDILIRDELEAIAEKHPDRLKIHYTLDRPPSTGWKYSSGFITEEMLKEHMPAPATDGSSQILMCGPPPMLKFACIPHLKSLGFKENHYVCY